MFVIVKMTMFRHEDFVLDLREAHRGKLYKNDQLVFMGDGYRAITILLKNSKDPTPVRQKFKAQLNMREKCKFTVPKNDT